MRAAVHSGRTHVGPNVWKRIEIIGPTKLENAMYKFEVHQVGKNKRITMFRTGGKCSEFCSVYVARPDEFAEIPKIKSAMVKHHRRKVERNGI